MKSDGVFLKKVVIEGLAPHRSTRSDPLLDEMRKAPRRANILIVDDDRDLREILRLLLVEKANIIEAVDGQKALEVMLGQRNTANLIITDIQMRGMEGPKFLAELRKSGDRTPAIIMSAKVMNKEDYEAIAALGPNVVFLPKPFDADKLLKFVNQFLVMSKIEKYLFSTRTMTVLLFIYAIAMGYATFIENDYDTATAKAVIYEAMWFEVLMVWLIVLILKNIKRYRLWSKEKGSTELSW